MCRAPRASFFFYPYPPRELCVSCGAYVATGDRAEHEGVIKHRQIAQGLPSVRVIRCPERNQSYMTKEFNRHIFATLTYARSKPSEEIWKTVSHDFNRYIQRIRRGKSRSIISMPPLFAEHRWEYFRCVEKHKDGYPHVHVLLQSKGVFPVFEKAYIQNPLRNFLKTSWTFGLSDFQVPRARSIGQLTYIMKYISKNKTTKTVWRKILTLQEKTSLPVHSALSLGLIVPLGTASVVVTPVLIRDHAATKTISSGTIWSEIGNIKLLTWSRKFDFSPFFPKNMK